MMDKWLTQPAPQAAVHSVVKLAPPFFLALMHGSFHMNLWLNVMNAFARFTGETLPDNSTDTIRHQLSVCNILPAKGDKAIGISLRQSNNWL